MSLRIDSKRFTFKNIFSFAVLAYMAIVFSPASFGQASWYSSWSYRKAITIDHTKVSGSTALTNFPILISITDADLAAGAQSSGNDILFTASDGATKLNHEVESYASGTGALTAWVQIPSLPATADTIIYIYFGNASATNQQNPRGVWDSSYKGIWHFSNGSSLSLQDSTSSGANATNNGSSVAAGQMGEGMSTNGSTYATIGTPTALANLAQGNATVSAWIKASSGTGGRIVGKDDGNGSRGWALGVSSTNKLDFVVVNTGPDLRAYSTANVATGSWVYVTLTVTGGSPETANMYVNGASAWSR